MSKDQLLIFSKFSIRRHELQLGLVELIELSNVDSGARIWLANQVEYEVEDLESQKTVFFGALHS